jgi:hypothetical protein
MKVVEGVTYYTIGEVAKKITRRTQTIKNWYEYAEAQEGKLEHPLPEVYQNLDSRSTRFFKECDIEMIIKFRDNIQYGQLADTNRAKWGERGQQKLTLG